MRIAFYGSSLLSSYWNGAATYYRGLLRHLSAFGYESTFYEPDVYDRQSHLDMDAPPWCRVVVYNTTPKAVQAAAAEAANADVVVKTSGVGYADDALLCAVMAAARPGALKIFWDVDAPATLAEITQQPFHSVRRALPGLDMVLTYGGGDAVVDAYLSLGARACAPIYNALDPLEHHPESHDSRFTCDLAFLGNRLPDREARVDDFFFDAARRLPGRSFLLGGAGWGECTLPANVRWVGHVPTRDHNAFNATPLAVLNVNRDSMAQIGFSPPTRVFEAAGAGACLITDAWEGVDFFLEPKKEVLIARNGRDVADLLQGLDASSAAAIGRRALARVLNDHTYAQRASLVDTILRGAFARTGAAA